VTPLDLLFDRARSLDPADALQLVFGVTGGPVPPPPPPAPDPSPGLIRAYVGARWSASARTGAGHGARWGASTRTGAAVRAPWSWTSRRGAALSAAWAATADRLGASVATRWSASDPTATAVRAPWQSTESLGVTRRAPWAGGQPASTVVRAPWAPGRVAQGGRVVAPWAGGAAVARRVAASGQDGLRSGVGVRAPWRTGRPISGTGGPIVLPPPPPAPGCRTDDPATDLSLRFASAVGGRLPLSLLFSCGRAALIVIPVRSVYMVTNVSTLVRVADGATIPCDGMSLSLDVDSWAWGFSATVPGDARALIAPVTPGAPIELQATVNGTAVRVLAESMRSNRTFGRHTVTVTGRGITALLDAPYALAQTFDNAGGALTAAQLIDQSLPPGWVSDWGLEDWLVPAGAWSFQGTPLQAALQVVQAGGGYLRPSRTLQQWDVLPRYPAGPWNWSTLTPDVSLPSAIVEVEEISEAEKARYNRVYVAGTGPGARLVRVTRDGTAGDVLAPMISSPLITARAAGRQRGLVVLADTGRVATVTLRLPVMPPAGVLQVGQLIDYVDGGVSRRGLVRGVSVSVSGAAVWQSVTVETNLG